MSEPTTERLTEQDMAALEHYAVKANGVWLTTAELRALLAEVRASRSLPLPAEVAELAAWARGLAGAMAAEMAEDGQIDAEGQDAVERLRTLADTCTALARRVQELEESVRDEGRRICSLEEEVARETERAEAAESRSPPAAPMPAASVEQLRAALRLVKQTLTVPAAEYVPAIGDAFTIIDHALAASDTGHAGGDNGLTVHVKPGGTWLEFRSKGKSAALCVETLAAKHEPGVIRSAILRWCKERQASDTAAADGGGQGRKVSCFGELFGGLEAGAADGERDR